MKIRKSTIDNIIIAFCLISPIIPKDFAKVAVLISISSLGYVLFYRQNFKYYGFKLIMIILLLPSIILTTFYSAENLIRFVYLLLLIIFYPYNLKLNFKYLNNLSFLIIFYLAITQLFIVFNYSFILDFRETLYPHIWGWVWDEGPITSFSQVGDYRSGGLYYNPNVLASLIILYFFIFLITLENFSYTRNYFYFFTFFLVVVSIILTDSRTVIVSLLVFFLLKILSYKKGKNLLKIMMLGTILLAALLIKDKILVGFSEMGSLNIKLRILFNYIENVNLLNLITGARYDVFFDSEYGYWLGALGLTGLISILLLITFLYKRIPDLRLFLLTFLLLSIGNSLFYGLLTGYVATQFIIITVCLYLNKLQNRI